MTEIMRGNDILRYNKESTTRNCSVLFGNMDATNVRYYQLYEDQISRCNMTIAWSFNRHDYKEHFNFALQVLNPNHQKATIHPGLSEPYPTDWKENMLDILIANVCGNCTHWSNRPNLLKPSNMPSVSCTDLSDCNFSWLPNPANNSVLPLEMLVTVMENTNVAIFDASVSTEFDPIYDWRSVKTWIGYFV